MQKRVKVQRTNKDGSKTIFTPIESLAREQLAKPKGKRACGWENCEIIEEKEPVKTKKEEEAAKKAADAAAKLKADQDAAKLKADQATEGGNK